MVIKLRDLITNILFYSYSHSYLIKRLTAISFLCVGVLITFFIQTIGSDVGIYSDFISIGIILQGIDIISIGTNSQGIDFYSKNDKSSDLHNIPDSEILEKLPGILWSSEGDTRKSFLDLLHLISKKEQSNFSTTTVKQALIVLQKIMKGLSNNPKGYINHSEISKLPVISDVYTIFYKESIHTGCDIKIYENILKWSKNLIYLHLLLFTIYLSSNVDDTDLLIDLKNFEKEIVNMLDNSIRLKLRKQGIKITQNVYCGFDTEYFKVNETTNKLLSIQHSLSTQTIVRIPVQTEYTYSSVNTQTGEVNIVEFEYPGFDSRFIINLVQCCINIYRNTKYNELDHSMKKLMSGVSKEVAYKKDGDYMILIFPNTPIIQNFKRTEKYSLEELVDTSINLVNPDLEKELNSVFETLKNAYESEEIEITNINNTDGIKNIEKLSDINILASTRKNIESVEISGNTDVFNRRTLMTSFTGEGVRVSIKKQLYLLIHHSAADLSMLSDFENFKENLDLVNKSFVSLGKSLKIKGLEIKIRDTQLLSPASSKSLSTLSKLYPEAHIEKLSLPKGYIENMEEFWTNDPSFFKEYALQDALITLIHGCRMAQFNLEIGGSGVPVTLSSLSERYLLKSWKKLNYSGYQPSQKYLLGDVSLTQTPKGMFNLGELALKVNMYIGNFKGGRNETFMYGEDTENIWFDNDIVSAYTSVMSMLGDPDYSKLKMISEEELKNMKKEEILYSYIIISCDFKFPDSVKYPSIGCFIDDTTTVYPLEGKGYLTGSEYLLALDQGCEFTIREIVYIPFNHNDFKIFKSTIKELQWLRSQHPKGSVSNSLYKELGNSLYGLTARGISSRKKYDIKIGKPVKLDVTSLSNPIICSWITSFIRSLVGELLHFVSLHKGHVISVTTDGIISNISDLENKILIATQDSSFTLFKEYQKIRKELSGNPSVLELKTSVGGGLLSWKTRGQYSTSSKITAMTGFQRKNLQASPEEMWKILSSTLKSEEKNIDFLFTTLRSSTEIYKKGGHVTPIFKDQRYSMAYDNKRRIKDEKIFSPSLKDSEPVRNKREAQIYRIFAEKNSSNYLKIFSGPKIKQYKNPTEIGVRNFLKAYFNNDLNLDSTYFKNYKEILEFFKGYQKLKISENYVSNIKRRKDSRVRVPKLREIEEFVKFVKEKFPEFDENDFFV